jgi:hypothetical protein
MILPTPCCLSLPLSVLLAGALCAIFLGYHVILGRPRQLLPTAQAGPIMVALIAACIVLPALAILAASRLWNSWRKQRQSATVSFSKQGGAAELTTAAAAAATAAATAAEVVRNSSYGQLVASSSGEMQLQLPSLLSDTGDTHQWALPVTNSRPPLQQLIDGWLATLQQLPQLPQPANKDAATGSSSSSSSSQRRGESVVRCTVYAMGPAPLVADAQVLCGRLKGLHFVQKAYQL